MHGLTCTSLTEMSSTSLCSAAPAAKARGKQIGVAAFAGASDQNNDFHLSNSFFDCSGIKASGTPPQTSTPEMSARILLRSYLCFLLQFCLIQKRNEFAAFFMLLANCKALRLELFRMARRNQILPVKFQCGDTLLIKFIPDLFQKLFQWTLDQSRRGVRLCLGQRGRKTEQTVMGT